MIYDAVVVLILLYTTYRGAAKGVAWQLAGVAALVLCFLFATPLSLVVAPAIKLDPPLNRWVAMLAIYLLFAFGCFALARSIRSALESLKFEEFDRHLGAIFGLLKGAALCLVATFFLVCLSEPAREYVLRTTSGRLSVQVLRSMDTIMPREFDRLLAPSFHTINRQLAEIALEDRQQAAGDEEDAFGGAHEETQFRGALVDDQPAGGSEAPTDAMVDQEQSDNAPGPRMLLDRAARRLKEGLRQGIDRFLGNAAQGGRGTPGDDEQPRETARTRLGEAARKAATGNRGATGPGPSAAALTAEICRLLEPRAAAQASLGDSIAALLNGIPESVVKGTLLDWRADLLGVGEDPDRETDVATSLDERLVRQLQAAGVPVDSLPRPVRERLAQ
jgi:membrane protein required for colicin V production